MALDDKEEFDRHSPESDPGGPGAQNARSTVPHGGTILPAYWGTCPVRGTRRSGLLQSHTEVATPPSAMVKGANRGHS
jgi:hypothetical protein